MIGYEWKERKSLQVGKKLSWSEYYWKSLGSNEKNGRNITAYSPYQLLYGRKMKIPIEQELEYKRYNEENSADNYHRALWNIVLDNATSYVAAKKLHDQKLLLSDHFKIWFVSWRIS